MFSKEWTAEDRLKLVIVLTDIIRGDIERGAYGVPGRPNVQAVHEMIAASPSTLESYRGDIERLLDTCSLTREPDMRSEFFATRFEDLWKED